MSSLNLIKGPAGTPTSQRRLRHLKCIMARTLMPRQQVSPFSLGDFFYTLHAPHVLEAEIKETKQMNGVDHASNGDTNINGSKGVSAVDEELDVPFYTSEVVANSMNPIWRHFDCSQFYQLDFIDSMSSFNICIWDCSGPEAVSAYPHVKNKDNNNNNLSDNSLPILQTEIDLYELEFIAVELRHLDFMFPPNSLIFELKDGLYVTKDTRDKMRPSRAELKIQLPVDKRKAVTCNQATFLSLIARRKQFLETQDNVNQLSSIIEKKLADHQAYFEKLRKRDALRLRIIRLHEECESHTNLLKTEEELLKVRRAELLPRARGLYRVQIALLASKQQLTNQELKTLEKDKGKLTTIRSSLDYRRWRLINQIKALYPISHSNDNKSLSINGYKLPNSDFTGCDEEQIATSLGCVSHILYLAAKYLEVPLRYPMIPMCSRSVILDEISQQTSPKFPLYSRGVDRTRFEYAVFLLNKNLEQLMNSQGLEIISLRHTLPNVQILLTRGQNLNV
jgi:hypothetical protein